jgi:O-antigen ligase
MKISKYLIYLLPAALVSGPLLSEIIIIFVSLNFLYISLKKKLFTYYQNTFSKFFFLFYFIINISSLFSPDRFYSLQTSIPYCRFYFFIIAFSYFIKNEKYFLKNLYYILLFVLVLVAISGYLEFLFNINFSINAAFIKEPHRLSGFFGSELIIGSYLSRLLPLLVILTIILKKDNFFSCSIVIFVFFIIFLSGERTSLFFGLITLISYIFLSYRNWFNKFMILVIVILISFYFISSNYTIKNRIFLETKNQIYNDEKIFFFSSEHTSHYTAALKMFIDKPLLGHGPKTFRINCQKPMYYENIHSCTTHPHNFLLQLLAEIGVFGFSIVFLFFYFLFFYLKKINKKFNLVSFNYIPLIVFTFPFVPNGNFFNNWLSMVSYLSISLSIYLLFIKNEKNKNSARI